MATQRKPKRVAIMGGGLVGSLNAVFMAQRGFHVKVYEMRPDIRTQEVVKGRSINLALSCRGRSALARVGLEDEVVSQGLPMYSRMIHDPDGTLRPIPYGKPHQYILSVDRRKLNEKLLDVAEALPDVELHFEHKFVSCDFQSGSYVVENTVTGERITGQADLVVGADGAYSGVRRQLMKGTRFDYQQTYIPHGYMELTIHPTPSGEFAMEPGHLHIWPRNEFMMISLPNQDCTWTTTLFMPFKIFDSLQTPEDLMAFFKDKFPDAIPLLGEKELKETFFSNKALPMVTVKCQPYHLGKVVIIGDAAHAMVPFYGQGMNCGFEDCIVLDDIITKQKEDLEKALEEYSLVRGPDAKAICDLAMYNYIEMRSSVNSRMFLMRKWLDGILYAVFPRIWIPLYTMVSFTRVPYHECIEKRRWQDRLLTHILQGMGVAALAYTGYVIYSRDDVTDVIHRVSDGAWEALHSASQWLIGRE